MEIGEAVRKAKEHLLAVLADEAPTNVGLEEVIQRGDPPIWEVTIGFSRPWNTVRNAFTAISGEPAQKRAYRTLSIDDATGRLLAITKKISSDD